MREPDEGLPSGARQWLLWVVAAIAALALLVFLWPSAPTAPRITYSAFIAQAADGNVAEATLKGQEVQGRFVKPTRIVGGRVLDGAATAAGGSYDLTSATDTSFRTTVPDGAQNGIVQLLDAHGATVRIEATGGGSSPFW